MKKIRWIITTILFIVLYIILIQINVAHGITQTLSPDINSIDDSVYPGVKQTIKNLQSQYPNWNFKILYTDLDWNEVIANEYTGHEGSPKNLVNGSNSKYSGDWICSICGPTKTFDKGTWNCASEGAIKYMMDPRNSLNSSDVFQFMELSYNEASFDQIKSMVTGTFLNNDSYINTILESGKEYNVNPYYIVARIIQEQGKNGSSTASGKYPGYEGYYNVFNFNASGNSTDEILSNAHSYAKKYGWTSIELSISGGVSKIASGYIAKGQNTLYFQKFDVENSDGNLYWHQYMQNILAAQSEGETLRKQFNSIGAINGSYTFIIPIYKNMPASACTRPSTISTPIDAPANNPTITTDLVRVNVNKTLSLRDAPNGNKLGDIKLNKDEIVTRLEKATEKVNGTYWDKVMKSDGTTGYAARETYDNESTYKLYLVPIVDNNENNNGDTTNPNENNNAGQTNTSEISDVTTTNIKVENSANRVTIIPETTIATLKSELNNTNIIVKDANGNTKGDNEKLATGYKINDKYSVSVIGDVSGDGIIDARDATRILKYSIGTYNLTNEYLVAADISKDGTADARDATRVLKYSVNQFKISF